MQYSWSYGPVAIDKEGITLGTQAVLGIKVGGEIKNPWDDWSKLGGSD